MIPFQDYHNSIINDNPLTINDMRLFENHERNTYGSSKVIFGLEFHPPEKIYPGLFFPEIIPEIDVLRVCQQS